MKKTSLDVNNMNEGTKKNDPLYSDIFGTGGSMAGVKSPGQKKRAEDLTLSTNGW